MRRMVRGAAFAAMVVSAAIVGASSAHAQPVAKPNKATAARSVAAGKGHRASRSRYEAPDPPALRSRNQWELTLVYRHGDLALASSRRVRYEQPVATPRRTGRFVAELLRGNTVVERVRFNFPLLGASPSTGASDKYFSSVGFEKKLTVTYGVMLPDTPRASRLLVRDRITGKSFTVPWPPKPAVGTKPAR